MTGRRISQRDVVDMALALLDEGGVEAVTLRGVARRLDVHLNSVSSQVGTKSRLLSLMADAMLGELSLDGLPDESIERVKEIFRRYRRVLLLHRDGAHLLAGTQVSERNTLRLGDAVISGLLAMDVGELLAVRTFWGLHYFLLGLVHEEQAVRGEGRARFEEILDQVDAPALVGVKQLMLDDPFDARLEFGLDALLHRARHHED